MSDCFHNPCSVTRQLHCPVWAVRAMHMAWPAGSLAKSDITTDPAEALLGGGRAALYARCFSFWSTVVLLSRDKTTHCWLQHITRTQACRAGHGRNLWRNQHADAHTRCTAANMQVSQRAALSFEYIIHCRRTTSVQYSLASCGLPGCTRLRVAWWLPSNSANQTFEAEGLLNDPK